MKPRFSYLQHFSASRSIHWKSGLVIASLLLSLQAHGQTPWTEGWQNAQARVYAPTDSTIDTILGDRGGWVVYDSSGGCGPGPHPNTAEILNVAGNKTLKLTAIANNCVNDLSVDLFSSPDIPLAANTLISFTETGALTDPFWNGAFPTLFPPPGDHVHLYLLDQGVWLAGS